MELCLDDKPAREYLEDVQDENRWENTFWKTQTELVAADRKAKQEIADKWAMSGDGGELCLIISVN